MDFSFLWPLVFAGVVFYILKHSADEIAYMSLAVFVVCLLVSLVSAPWQMQLLLLVLVLVGTQRLSQSADVKVGDVRPAQGVGGENAGMSVDGSLHEHLSYRGVDYEVDLPVVEETEREITGTYRGQVWSCHEVKSCDLPQVPVEIKYRGATIKMEPVAGDEQQV